MLRRDLLNRNVPRLECDHRAREARLRLERVERLLVKRARLADRRPLLFVRLFGFVVNGRRGYRDTGSLSGRRPSAMPILMLAERAIDLLALPLPFEAVV